MNQSSLFDEPELESATWDLPCGKCGGLDAYYEPPIDHGGCVNRRIVCRCGRLLGEESVRKDLIEKTQRGKR